MNQSSSFDTTKCLTAFENAATGYTTDDSTPSQNVVVQSVTPSSYLWLTILERKREGVLGREKYQVSLLEEGSVIFGKYEETTLSEIKTNLRYEEVLRFPFSHPAGTLVPTCLQVFSTSTMEQGPNVDFAFPDFWASVTRWWTKKHRNKSKSEATFCTSLPDQSGVRLGKSTRYQERCDSWQNRRRSPIEGLSIGNSLVYRPQRTTFVDLSSNAYNDEELLHVFWAYSIWRLRSPSLALPSSFLPN